MRPVAAKNLNGSFWNLKMFGQHFNKSFVGLAIMRLGAEIDGKLARGGLNDFFLGRTGLNGD